jgi:hypothetical protein
LGATNGLDTGFGPGIGVTIAVRPFSGDGLSVTTPVASVIEGLNCLGVSDFIAPAFVGFCTVTS